MKKVRAVGSGHAEAGARRLPPLLAISAALALAGVAAGCGNVTSGGLGEVEVVMSSGEVEGGQTTADVMPTVLSEALGGAEATSHLTELRGTLTVRVRSFARARDGTFEEITDGVQEVVLSLEDPQPLEIARRSLPAGPYDAVRTFFGRIEANIEGGLIIDGRLVTGPVRVNLGPGGTLSIVDYTGFEVVEDQPTTIALEMHSRIWLRLADAVLQEVDVEDFRRTFRVRVWRLLLGA